MLSGRPVILLYDAHLFGIHPETEPLMLRLERAQIAFRDPERAAQHLNRYFFDPSDWWGSRACLGARRAFLDALNCDSSLGLGSFEEMLRMQLPLVVQETQ